MEFIFTEDSYYQLAGYRSGLQDVADMIHVPLHCVAKAVCGQMTKTLFPVLRCQLPEECCRESPWILGSWWPMVPLWCQRLTVTSPTG